MLRLRRAVLDDVPLLTDWNRQPHVLAALNNDEPYDWTVELTEADAFTEHVIAEGDGRPVGYLAIIDPAREHTHYWGEVEPDQRALDIWIGEPADLGRGLGTQMMRSALARCFAAPEVTGVLLDPLTVNVDARRFYARLGFVEIGPRRFGEDDCTVYRIDRTTWEHRADAAKVEAGAWSGARRPVIAIPARFSQSAAALRYRAEVGAEALITAVFAAGGEPVLIHPHAPGGRVDHGAVRERIARADGVLLPGGGDLSARWYGAGEHDRLYDVDEEQDAFDLALARVCLNDGIPLLAICRGLQVVTVALGGTLVQHLGDLPDAARADHRHHVHTVDVEADSVLAEVVPNQRIEISCYHHQCVDAPGEGMVVIARAEDGIPEAYALPAASGWFLGVQWHPEDTARENPDQAAIFAAHVRAAAARGVRA